MKRVTSLHEVATLLIPRIVKRLSKESRTRLAWPSEPQGLASAIEHLASWLGHGIPESVSNDPAVDNTELVFHSWDLLKGLSSKQYAAVLGLANSDATVPTLHQTRLYLPFIEVPSDPIYYQVRRAVATKGFFSSTGTPFPTAPINTHNARGQAQLKPLILDTGDRPNPEYEAELARLMFQQRDELSDTDSDIWDYCNWRWLLKAEHAEQYVSIVFEELQTMRGIIKKLNGRNQRGGYKRAQRDTVLKSIIHLRNVLINLFEFEFLGHGVRAGRLITEPVQDRAIRLEDGGQFDLDGGIPKVTSFMFRPGTLFSRYLFGPGRETALLSAKALSYDPRYQKYEKRLLRYFSWIWRIRAFKLDYFQPFRISSLLDAIDLRVNRRFPSRTLESFETAMETLEADGNLSWQYASAPLDRNAKGWVNAWLDATITVEPPQGIFDQYRSIGKKHSRAQVVDIGEFADFAERLREKRVLANMTVMVAAQNIGVSPDDYLLAENGRRPRPSVSEKLKKWLDETVAS